MTKSTYFLKVFKKKIKKKISLVILSREFEMSPTLTNIISTANESIPVKNSKKIFHTKIPKYLRMLVKHKKYLLKKKYDSNSQRDLNLLSRVIKEEVNILRNINWMKFTSNVQENPLSSGEILEKNKCIKK